MSPAASNGKYYGKYRGMVLNNVDPMQIGRLLVQVPDVMGPLTSSWAMPCMPFASIQAGIYAVPPIKAGVWVEFEQGDPDHPIWVGGFWGLVAEVPALALVPAPPPGQNIVLQTTGQNTVLVSDVPGPTGGIMLKAKTNAMLSLSDTGVILTDGKGGMITITAGVVTVNQGALVIK
jgi:uncharacterized protein involved in type VI secretion and phage assembly